jgi:hypothetical protein
MGGLIPLTVIVFLLGLQAFTEQEGAYHARVRLACSISALLGLALMWGACLLGRPRSSQ